nr:DUF190 domain-containing protein [Marinitoga lauensis]
MNFLRIYLGESDHCGHEPAYKHIVKLCYNHGLKGVTVLKGVMDLEKNIMFIEQIFLL